MAEDSIDVVPRTVVAEQGTADASGIVGAVFAELGRGRVDPAILERDGPIVATSVKTDLLGHTLDHRTNQGEVWIYDPTRSVDVGERAGWSPLAACHEWQGALRTATWLVESARDHAELTPVHSRTWGRRPE